MVDSVEYKDKVVAWFSGVCAYSGFIGIIIYLNQITLEGVMELCLGVSAVIFCAMYLLPFLLSSNNKKEESK